MNELILSGLILPVVVAFIVGMLKMDKKEHSDLNIYLEFKIANESSGGSSEVITNLEQLAKDFRVSREYLMKHFRNCKIGRVENTSHKNRNGITIPKSYMIITKQEIDFLAKEMNRHLPEKYS